MVLLEKLWDVYESILGGGGKTIFQESQTTSFLPATSGSS